MQAMMLPLNNLQEYLGDKMKTYIFVTVSITNTGGSQRYVAGKKKFLKDNGWNVLVISIHKIEAILSELKEYAEWIFPVLSLEPASCSKNMISNILNKIAKYSENSEYIIVESNHVNCALWGELIAKKCNAKHIAYIVDEQPICPKYIIPFMIFKHDRKELACITKDGLSNMFKGAREISDENILRAAGGISNVVSDYDFPLFKSLGKANYSIGSIGRLEKPYVISMCEQVCLFAKKYSEKSLNFILIGSGPEIVENNIRKKISECKNINLLITGSLSQIPKSFFSIVDVVIASSGSAIVACKEQAVTISINAENFKPLGILGYTTHETLFSDKPAEFDLHELLEKILINKYHKNLKSIGLPERMNESDETVYKKHFDFIENSDKTHVYFNTIIRIFSIKQIRRRILSMIFCKKNGDFSKAYWIIREYYLKLKFFKIRSNVF